MSSTCSFEDNPFDNFIILSVTHKSAEAMDAISSLVIKRENRRELLADLKEALDAEEILYISTCNRVSFIIVSHRKPDVLLQVLRHWFMATIGNTKVPPAEQWNRLNGRKAIDQLLMVTSSLDSMVVGERQILGQVKEAYKDCMDWGISGATISFVMEQAFKIVKKVYSSTAISHGTLSVVSLVEKELQRRCEEGRPLYAVLVGAGKMTEKIAEFLTRYDHVSLSFVNRTLERGKSLADRFGGRVRSLDAFISTPDKCDILATSTAAPHAIFTAGLVHECKGDGELTIVDLAIPADVELSAGKERNVNLINMESLRRQSRAAEENRGEHVQQAEEIIRNGAESLIDRWKIRTVNPAIGELTQRLDSESVTSLDRLFDSELAHLGESERIVLKRWAGRLAKNWAVVQATGVRETARKCCSKAVVTYLESMGFGVQNREHKNH